MDTSVILQTILLVFAAGLRECTGYLHHTALQRNYAKELLHSPNKTNRLTFCLPDIAMPLSCYGRRTMQVSEFQTIDRSNKRISIDNEDVTFIVFRRENQSPKEIVIDDDKSLYDSSFKVTSKTKILVHGYFSSGKNLEHIAYAYLTARDYNVIVMDWSALAKWCYCEHVLFRITAVGERLARLLEFLVRHGVLLDDIHIVGHSLGSHIAGVASRACKNGRVARISALDPAKPGFTVPSHKERLNRHAAHFVDVIHTCAEMMGIGEPLGHVDFYPNGGLSPQPGCEGQSITTDVGFRAVQCDNWTQFKTGNCYVNVTAVMGERVNQSQARGMYFLKTGATCPFYIAGNSSSVTSPMLLLLTIMFFTNYFLN